MRVTFFGTGSSIPTPQLPTKPFRSFASFSVEIDNDFLLFDIGPGTVTKMLQRGVDILQKPTSLFISHFHLDHCLDYITLMKARSLNHKLTNAAIHPLQVFGPKDLEVFSKNLFEGIEKWDYMTKELDVFSQLTLKETVEGLVTKTPSWKVTCMPIKHYNGVCYRLDAGGKSLVYSGDMGYDENIALLGKDADLAILECSYPSKKENKGLHLCPEEIGELAKQGHFKRVILTHLYPACEGREEEIIASIKAIANCEVTIAYDTFQVDL